MVKSDLKIIFHESKFQKIKIKPYITYRYRYIVKLI